jgi:small subunit ribosomal protein S17
MADEEKNETQENGAEEAPKAEEKPEAEEKPAADQKPEAEEAPADEAPAEEEAPKDDASSDPADVAEEEGGDWKTRRRLERSRRPAEPGPSQTPEERAAARGDARKLAGRSRAAYRTKRRTKGEAGTGTPPAEGRSAGRKTRQGRVVSSKANKTITVRIEVARRHPEYEKIVRRSNTLYAHDAQNEAGEGDLVQVIETRPLSRTKRWRLVQILEKAK